VHNFKKLDTWNIAMSVAKATYLLVKGFPKDEVYGLTSQIKRSAVSIPSNIAEGAGRNNKGEFRHFLGIAAGSAYELETQLLLSEQFGYASSENLQTVYQEIEMLQKKIYNLIKSLN